MPKAEHVLIVLNGASSSGKTSIANELIAMLGTECVYTGFDEILERVQPIGTEGLGIVNRLSRAIRILHFNATDGRFNLFKRLHREIVAHCTSKRSVIVETSMMDRRILLDAAEQFAPLDGFFVGVKPPVSVSMQWESQRGDRPAGQAQLHYDRIHAHGIYDLEIDPSQMTPGQCAALILEEHAKSRPRAFHKILDHARKTS
jgi:chloramphenicol 3-O phosphotransferase